MDRRGQISSSLQRLITERVEALDREANVAVARSAGAGRLNSSMHIQEIERLCRDGYRSICNAAATQLAEIEGEDAYLQAEVLDEVLRSAQLGASRVFHLRSAPGMSSVAGFAANRKGPLLSQMDNIRQGVIDDLRLGITEGVNVKKHKDGVTIDNRGGSGQFNIHSPGAAQHIGRDQIAGTSPEELASLLQQIRNEASAAAIDAESRESIGDALLNIQREADQSEPDTNRLARLFRRAAETAEKIGVPVITGLITTYLHKHGL